MTNRILVIGCALLCLAQPAHTQEKRLRAWKGGGAVQLERAILLQAPDPTLAAPVLEAEPEYTWGRANTLHWDITPVLTNCTALGHALLAFEIEARYLLSGEVVTLWGFVDAAVDSATFANLPEGLAIDYRLRYFAQNGSGEYLMSYWSEIETSIQDLKPPVLHALSGVQAVQQIGLQRWIVGELARIRVVASDSTFGKVMQVSVEEVSETGTRLVRHDIIPPRLHVDTTLQHVLYAPMKTPFQLRVWATDVALQESDPSVESLVWWPEDEGTGRLICFPNPYSPQGATEPVKIKVGVPNVSKARIFDPFGNLVITLRKQKEQPFFSWDGRNGQGDLVANGGYICVVDGKTDLYCKIAVIR